MGKQSSILCLILFFLKATEENVIRCNNELSVSMNAEIQLTVTCLNDIHQMNIEGISKAHLYECDRELLSLNEKAEISNCKRTKNGNNSITFWILFNEETEYIYFSIESKNCLNKVLLKGVSYYDVTNTDFTQSNCKPYFPMTSQKIILRNNGLVRMPTSLKVMNNLTELSFRGQNFSKNQLKIEATNLETLKIMKSGLRDIAKVNLKDLKRLQHLDLSGNNLTFVFKSTLTSTLISLNLEGNQIKKIRVGVWSDLPHLEVLNLSGNKISTLPTNLPTSLVNMNISSNHIEFISPRTFEKLTKLKVLCLRGIGLIELPRGISNTLTHYDVRDNQLKRIYDNSQYEFCGNCDTFFISNNAWICDAKLAKMLVWFKEHSKNISQGNAVLCQGRNILVNNLMSPKNLLEILNYGEQNARLYPGCKILILQINCTNLHFKKLPETVVHTSEIFVFSGNPKITNIKNGYFYKLQNLTRLELENNQILKFPKKLPNSLHHLSLAGNNISAFTAEDRTSVTNLIKLQNFNLARNKIHTVQSRMFLALKLLQKLDIESNPLICDCNLIHFSRWYEQTFNESSGKTQTCANSADSITQFANSKLECYPNVCKVNEMSVALDCSNTNLKFYGDNSTNLHRVYFTQMYWDKIHLAGLNLKNVDFPNLQNQIYLKSLDISNNLLTHLPFEKLSRSIEHINASGNKLNSDYSNGDLQNFKKLSILDLRHNQISRIEHPQISLFSFNQIICDCELAQLKEWWRNNEDTLTSEKKYDYKNLSCSTPENLRGKLVHGLTESNFCPQISALLIVGIIAGIVATFSTVFAVTCFAFKKKRRERIKKDILQGFENILKMQVGTDAETGEVTNQESTYEYDAFVSACDAEDDREFVYTLKQELETKRNIKLCLHDRDFKPGVGVADNITEGFLSSRHVILVISNAYTSSEWCHYQLQTALTSLQHNNRNQYLIPILIEDLDHKSETSGNIYTTLKLLNFMRIPKSNCSRNWNSFWINLSERIVKS